MLYRGIQFNPESPNKSMINYDHLLNILVRLKSQKDSNSHLCDFVINSEDKKIKVHRVVMAAFSHAFCESFKVTPMLEMSTGFMKTPNDSQFLNEFIESIYTDKIIFNISRGGIYYEYLNHFKNPHFERSFLRYARRMQFSTIQALHIFNCLHKNDSYLVSKIKFYEDLKYQILNDFHQAAKSDVLPKLDYDVFQFLVNHPGNGASEDVIINAINRYVDSNSLEESQIRNLFANIYQKNENVKFSPKIPQEVAQKYSNSSLVQRPGSSWFILFSYSMEGEHKYLIFDIMQKKFLYFEDCKQDYFKKFEEVMADNVFFSIEVIGGQLGGLHEQLDNDSLPFFKRYENNKWLNGYKTQYHINDFIQSNFRIISVGGLDKNRGVELIGAAVYGDGPWRLFKTLGTRSRDHALCLISGCVYKFGGYSSDSNVTNQSFSIQLWPTASEWKQLAQMTHPRYMHKAVHFDGRVYVFSGYSSFEARAQDIPRVNEFYTIRENKWTQFPTPEEAFTCIDAIEVSGLIYIFGTASATELIKCYSFDPETLVYKELSQFNLVEPISVNYGLKINQHDLMNI